MELGLPRLQAGQRVTVTLALRDSGAPGHVEGLHFSSPFSPSFSSFGRTVRTGVPLLGLPERGEGRPGGTLRPPPRPPPPPPTPPRPPRIRSRHRPNPHTGAQGRDDISRGSSKEPLLQRKGRGETALCLPPDILATLLQSGRSSGLESVEFSKLNLSRLSSPVLYQLCRFTNSYEFLPSSRAKIRLKVDKKEVVFATCGSITAAASRLNFDPL